MSRLCWKEKKRKREKSLSMVSFFQKLMWEAQCDSNVWLPFLYHKVFVQHVPIYRWPTRPMWVSAKLNVEVTDRTNGQTDVWSWKMLACLSNPDFSQPEAAFKVKYLERSISMCVRSTWKGQFHPVVIWPWQGHYKTSLLLSCHPSVQGSVRVWGLIVLYRRYLEDE